MSHDSPVSQGGLIMPLGQSRRVVLPDNTHVITRQERRVGNLEARHEEVLPRHALQQISSDRRPENDLVGRLAAEHNHVVEVTALLLELVLRRCRGFSEDAARGEDLPDGTDNGAQGRQREVARIVLERFVSCDKQSGEYP